MKVGIVGAGAAGLRAAMLLRGRGVEVSLIEARDRIGGRLETPTHAGKALYDAGGEWIDADHRRVLDLSGELDVRLDSTGFWPGRVVFRDARSTEDLLWADALEDDLRVEAAARELCRNLVNPPWRNDRHASLDRRTLDEFLREHCTSERGLWWLQAKNRSDEGEDPERISLLGWLCGYLHYLDRDPAAMSAYRFAEGAAALCHAMLTKTGIEPRYGAVLRHVRQDPQGVTLEFEEGEARVDAAILTLPPPALERVIFDPPLAVEKRCAIEACRMSPAIKIAWEFDEPWWLDDGWNGRMLCDRSIQQTWDGTRGGPPILCAYVGGSQATRWLESPHPVEDAFAELEEVAPAARGRMVRGWLHAWPSDPYSCGAFSNLAPGYALEYMEHISTPESRVSFAGEHTSVWTGFIEGALESGERAAEEVLNA